MLLSLFFFFNDTATTEIYTLSLHDALPISTHVSCEAGCGGRMFTTFYMNPQNLGTFRLGFHSGLPWAYDERSEEHTSELQSRLHLVCRLLLEKKKKRSQAHDRAT